MAFAARIRPIVILRLAFIALLLGLIIYFFAFSSWRPHSVAEARHGLELLGPGAPFVAAGIQAVAVVFLIPGFLLIIATAIVFGPESIWINLLGQIGGASFCFFIARYLGRDFFRSMLGPRLRGIELILQEHGFRYLMYMRFMMVIPQPFVTYAPGLVPLKYRNFVFATLLGDLPFVVVVGLFGRHLVNVHHARDLIDPQFILPALLLLGLLTIPLTVAFLHKRRAVARARAGASTPGPEAPAQDDP